MGLLLWLLLPTLTTNDVSPISRMCLSFTSTVTDNDDRPLLGTRLANPCVITIGNEFLESEASLEITGLKCCILAENN